MPRQSRSSKSGCNRYTFAGCAVAILPFVVLVCVYISHNQPPNLVIPRPTPPADNAFNDFLAAADLNKVIRHKAPASMTKPPTTRAGLLAVSAACTNDAAEALKIMRRGFAKECLAPVIRSTGETTFAMEYGAQARDLERTISGVRLYYAITGQPLRAADAALDGEELGVMFPRGGSLIESLIGIAFEAISLARFEPLIPRLSKPELAHVARRLDVIAAKRAPWSDVVLEEGRSTTAILQESLLDPKNQGFRANYETARTLMSFGGSQSPTPEEVWQAINFQFADKAAMLREYLHYYEMAAEEARGPYATTSNVKAPNNLFVNLTGDLVFKARAKYETARAIIDLLRLEVALYRFKADHGAFPLSLSQLAPEYVSMIPIDPFGGLTSSPFHYSTTTAAPGFLLYSVGPDMTDNRGVYGKNPDNPGFDIVAGHLWAQKPEY